MKIPLTVVSAIFVAAFAASLYGQSFGPSPAGEGLTVQYDVVGGGTYPTLNQTVTYTFANPTAEPKKIRYQLGSQAPVETVLAPGQSVTGSVSDSYSVPGAEVPDTQYTLEVASTGSLEEIAEDTEDVAERIKQIMKIKDLNKRAKALKDLLDEIKKVGKKTKGLVDEVGKKPKTPQGGTVDLSGYISTRNRLARELEKARKILDPKAQAAKIKAIQKRMANLAEDQAKHDVLFGPLG